MNNAAALIGLSGMASVAIWLTITAFRGGGKSLTHHPEQPLRIGTRQIILNLGWFLAAAPCILFMIMVAQALHLRFVLGRWPIVYKDEPNTPLLFFHEYFLLAPMFYIALLSIPGFLVAGTIAQAGRRTFLGQMVLMLLGIIALVIFFKYDRTGYIEWFMD